MADAAIQKALDMVKEHDVKYVDFRFTDPRGKWQHLAHHIRTVDADFLENGLMFDGSSIAGWKAINESDMILKPDLDAVYVDPFSATPMMIVCRVRFRRRLIGKTMRRCRPCFRTE